MSTFRAFAFFALVVISAARPEISGEVVSHADKKAGDDAVVPPNEVITQIDLGISSTGDITSPNYPSNYPNNADSQYILNVPVSGARIHLVFRDFTTESNYDFVSVYDGTSTSSPLLGRYSGSNLPPRLVSSGNQLLVRFQSDGSIVGRGFSASYALNNQDVALSSAGSFSSPFYPLNYPNNINYVYRLQSRSSIAKLRVDFSNDSYTEGRYDILEVRDGSSASSPLIGIYSGSTFPQSLVSSGSNLYVKFSTDGSVTYSGFSANFVSTLTYNASSGFFGDYASSSSGPIINEYVINAPNAQNFIQLRFTNFNLDNSSQNVEVRDGPSASSTLIGVFTGSIRPETIFSSGSQLFVKFTSTSNLSRGFAATFNTGSRVFLNGSAGHFTSLNYPSNYPNSHLTQYVIQVPDQNEKVRVAFESFQTERNYDFVEIYDGAGTQIPLLGIHSGTSAVPVYASSSNSLSVVFRTDSSVVYPGFFAVYQSVPASCAGLITHIDGTEFTYDELRPKSE